MLPNRQALADSKCWGTGWVLYRSETVDGGFEEPYRLWGLCAELGGSSDYPSATRPTEADARIPLQARPACRGSRSPSSGAASLQACARRLSSLVLAAIGLIATSSFSSCILTSVLDKGEPAARWGRKAHGPYQEKAAGLPKGDSK